MGCDEERLVLGVVVLCDDAALLAWNHECREARARSRMSHDVEDFPSKDGSFTDIAARDRWVVGCLRMVHLDPEASLFHDVDVLKLLPLYDE